MDLTPFPDGSGQYIFDIAIHPDNPAILYVGLELKIVKSEDYGITWTDISAISTGLPTATEFKKLFIDPDSPNTVFVKTLSGGLYKTSDAGLNWAYCGPGYSVGNHKDFCWSPNGDVLYQTEHDRMYKSVDAGDTWTHTYTHINGHNICVVDMKTDNTDMVFFISNDEKKTDNTDMVSYQQHKYCVR